MIVGVPKETFPGERRVALVPNGVSALLNAGFEVYLESGAGKEASFMDHAYEEVGVNIFPNRSDIFARADVIIQVRGVGSNPETDLNDFRLLREKQIIIGFLNPLVRLGSVKELADRKVQSFAMELIPRISRAQSMDALSSQANVAGYKAALVAAEMLPRMFPMMMTAAGTVTPARVLVVGAGVAGLQAIATCHRLGAVVSAYDIRTTVKEQVQSLGAKFVELELETAETEEKEGYAKAMDEEFYRKQGEMMSSVVANSDVVITTAAVPGKKAPVLITGDMVDEMRPGSVIVDLAAEQGGNCEITESGKDIKRNGVTVTGPNNLPSTVPYHSSQMYSKNITNFLLLMVKDKKLDINVKDEIVRDALVTLDGQIVNARVKENFEL